MALLAESLVDEWLNRQRFFTIRGIKHGVDEIDLLGVRPRPDGGLEAWHVEVQVSFRPISYLSKLPDEHREFATSRTSAKRRPDNIVADGVAAWVKKKFTAPDKIKTREQAWPGQEWRYKFVHGVLRHPIELYLVRAAGVETISFHEVLTALGKRMKGEFTGGAGTDLSDIIKYFADPAHGK